MSVRIETETQPSGTTVAVVTLDDPARRNILSPELLADLAEVLTRLRSDELLGAVVLTGAGPAFCGGAPLTSLAGAGAGDGVTEAVRRETLGAIYEGFLAIERLEMPTVAAVNGPAVGAGLNLALACDVRLAGRSARFDSRFLSLGLHPGGGHTASLARLLGPEAARAMVLFGAVLDGEEAARRGLAWRCVADEDLAAEALGLARAAAAAPPGLARRAKATMRLLEPAPARDVAVRTELEAQLWSLTEPDFAERIAAAARSIGRRAD